MLGKNLEEHPNSTCSSRGILGGFDGLSFREQCGKSFPSTLVGKTTFSHKQKAEKGFLGGFDSPSSRDQCERSFHPSSPTSQPCKSNPWLFQPRNPSSTAAVTSPHNNVHMTRLVSDQSIVIFRQASRAQKQTTALFKWHYGPGRTGRCSPTCTVGPGASKWYSAFGNLPSFSKLPHGGWVPTDTIIKHHHRLQCV